MKKNIQALTRGASFVPATADKEARTVQLTWTTGSRVLRDSVWSGTFYEELSVSTQSVRMERLNAGAPFLNSHNQGSLSDVLGVVERAWIENGEGKAVVRFSDRPEVQGVFNDIASGIIRGVSVGYRVNKFDRVGEQDGVPVMRATDWMPFELSAVAVGADGQAGFRSSDELNACTIEGTDMEQEMVTKAAEVTATEAATEAATAPAVTAAPAVDAEAVRAEAAALERSRVAQIFETATKVKLDSELARKHIEAGTSVEQFRKEAIEMLATKVTIQTARVESGEMDETATRVEAAKAAILHRANPSAFKLEEVGKAYAGQSLLRIAEDFVANGRNLSRTQLAHRALTTASFVQVLSDVANKTLRRAYELQPKTWEPIVTRGVLPDYRPTKRVALGEAPSLQAIAEGASYVEGTIGEGSETIQVAKYGRSLIFTDILLANDAASLDALSRVPALMGAAAARLESQLVYAVLTGNPLMADGKAIFHIDHKNLASPAALDVAGLNAAKKLMRKQKGLDGQDFLDIMPAYLVVGPDQELTARQLLSSAVVPGTPGEVNPFAASMQLIVDPRIDGLKWFLSASPANIDTIEVATLEGMTGPEVSSETEWDNDSVKMKVKHVFGVRCMDHRGLVYSAGA